MNGPPHGGQTCATMCSGIRTRTATEPLVAAMLSEWCLDLTREPE